MKNSIFIKGITLFLLSMLVATSSAGCLCVDNDCCFISMQKDGSSSMQESGSDDCDCGCTIDRCATIIQNSTSHQYHSTVQSILRFLGQQTLVASFYSQIVLFESAPQIPISITHTTSPSNSFLYSSKTTSLLI